MVLFRLTVQVHAFQILCQGSNAYAFRKYLLHNDTIPIIRNTPNFHRFTHWHMKPQIYFPLFSCPPFRHLCRLFHHSDLAYRWRILFQSVDFRCYLATYVTRCRVLALLLVPMHICFQKISTAKAKELMNNFGGTQCLDDSSFGDFPLKSLMWYDLIWLGTCEIRGLVTWLETRHPSPGIVMQRMYSKQAFLQISAGIITYLIDAYLPSITLQLPVQWKLFHQLLPMRRTAQHYLDYHRQGFWRIGEREQPP